MSFWGTARFLQNSWVSTWFSGFCKTLGFLQYTWVSERQQGFCKALGFLQDSWVLHDSWVLQDSWVSARLSSSADLLGFWQMGFCNTAVFRYDDDVVVDQLRQNLLELRTSRLHTAGDSPPAEEPTKPFGLERVPTAEEEAGYRQRFEPKILIIENYAVYGRWAKVYVKGFSFSLSTPYSIMTRLGSSLLRFVMILVKVNLFI